MADIPKLRDVLKTIAQNTGAVVFEKYDGKLALSPLDNGASVKTIDASMTKLNDSGLPSISIGYTDIDKIITRVDVKYKRIVPEDDAYAGVSFCNRLDAPVDGTPIHNFTLSDTNGGGDYYAALLQNAYEYIQEDKPLTVYADCIRDAATAERLARLIILLRYKPMAELSIECTYAVADLELGDKVVVSSAYLPAALTGLTYAVTGIRIMPNIGSNPGISLRLTELGPANLTAPVEWQDTFGTGTEYQDNMTGTMETKQEVF